MGYANRYKKEGCATHKDVDFSKIATNAKIKVPAMVISSFQKKVGNAKKAFDVTIDVDSDTCKCRLVIKKLEASDVTLEWEDRESKQAGVKKQLIQVRTAITSYAMTNATYLKKMEAAKAGVKLLKDDVLKLEQTIPAKFAGSQARGAFLKQLGVTAEALTKAGKDGFTLFREHQDWYLNGPRKGVAPILSKAGLTEKDLSKEDAEDLGKKLHEMSAAANEVKTIYDLNVNAAVGPLLTRLKNIEVQVTKTAGGALEEVKKNLAEEVNKLKELVGKAQAETKAEKSITLTDQLKDPNSTAYKRLQKNPQFIAVEMESNKTRLATIPKYIDLVEKQCKRVAKGIPMGMIEDPQIVNFLKQLDSLDQQNKKNLTEAKKIIEVCDQALVEFKKSLNL